MRCVHEASLYDDNCFITLTYHEQHLPWASSLDKSAFPKFMKRLRKRYPDERIRYFHCGEYGDRFGRPHYHALLFGFDFHDKEDIPSRGKNPVWRSHVLEKVWPYGRSEIGSLTFESAAYCARYVTKKITGALADDFYTVDTPDGNVAKITPPYATMSRRPGIGMEWYKQFKCEVYAADSVVVRGKEMKPPRFYDGQFELENPEGMRAIKRARAEGRNENEQRSSRLLARRAVVEANLAIKERSLC